MTSHIFAPSSTELGRTPTTSPDGMVEIGLLLPTKRVEDLLRLARTRKESIGQILRGLIERELTRPE